MIGILVFAVGIGVIGVLAFGFAYLTDPPGPRIGAPFPEYPGSSYRKPPPECHACGQPLQPTTKRGP